MSTILTRGEVELHKSRFPNNVLVLVSEIVLTGEDKTIGDGGNVSFHGPWTIHEDSLTVIGYTYRLQNQLSGD